LPAGRAKVFTVRGISPHSFPKKFFAANFATCGPRISAGSRKMSLAYANVARKVKRACLRGSGAIISRLTMNIKPIWIDKVNLEKISELRRKYL
jgi:hypothetical protein